jgi:hypothetical protein
MDPDPYEINADPQLWYLGAWAHLVLAELPGYGLDEVAAGGEGDDAEGCAQHTQLLRRAQDVLHRDILENKFTFCYE